MTKRARRRFSPEYKEQAVARLSEPWASYGSVAAELGVTATQLKTWKLELDAAGSAAAIAAQRAEADELVQLRRDNKRLKEEVEVLRKASAFSLSGRRNREGEAPRCARAASRRRRRPGGYACDPFPLPGPWRLSELVSCPAPRDPAQNRARCQTC
ncbi:MAG: transposase [Pseudomonadota bacterium]